MVAQVFGKFNIAGALRDQGVNPVTIAEGSNADAQFPFSNYNRQQLAQVNHLVDHIYLGFIQKVRAERVVSLQLRLIDSHGVSRVLTCSLKR